MVVGAGMGGLAAAGALADHFEEVVVLERDILPGDDSQRPGIPQRRHVHALLAGGRRALADLFPDFEQGGFRGPLNRYRCQQRDWKQLTELRGATVGQPSFFVAGGRDPVRRFVPGADLYADPGAARDDFRGSLIVEGRGHWIQHEAPSEVTQALLGFLDQV